MMGTPGPAQISSLNHPSTSTGLFSLWALPPPQSQHAVCTQNGIHASIFKETERRELVGFQLPVLLQVDNSRCILYGPGDPSRTQSLLPTAMTLIICLNIGFSSFSLPLIIPPFYFLGSFHSQKAPPPGGRSLRPADSQETPN